MADWTFLTNHSHVLVCIMQNPRIRLSEIAEQVGITERTVKAHLTSVYQRIGVTDRTQAALWIQRRDRT